MPYRVFVRHPGRSIVFGYLFLVVVCLFSVKLALNNQTDTQQLRKDLGVIRNCELARTGRIEANRQRKLLREFFENEIDLAREERPYLQPLFLQLSPKVLVLVKRSRQLERRLVTAEHALEVPVCTTEERPQ